MDTDTILDQHATAIEQFAWMRDQLRRYTYRPGWTLTLEPGDPPYSGPVLIVRYPALDSRNPHQQSQFECRRPIDPHLHHRTEGREAAFGGEIQRVLFDTELHESREWLRRDGALFDDPHSDPNLTQCVGCGASGGRRDGIQRTCPGCGKDMR